MNYPIFIEDMISISEELKDFAKKDNFNEIFSEYIRNNITELSDFIFELIDDSSLYHEDVLNVMNYMNDSIDDEYLCDFYQRDLDNALYKTTNLDISKINNIDDLKKYLYRMMNYIYDNDSYIIFLRKTKNHFNYEHKDRIILKNIEEIIDKITNFTK